MAEHAIVIPTKWVLDFRSGSRVVGDDAYHEIERFLRLMGGLVFVAEEYLDDEEIKSLFAGMNGEVREMAGIVLRYAQRKHERIRSKADAAVIERLLGEIVRRRGDDA